MVGGTTLRSVISMLFVAVATAPQESRATYSMVKSYAGSSFFDGWEFYNHYDNLTNGDTVFVGQNSTLAYVNSAGNAIIKVDNVTTVPYNEKRNSVRIQTTESYKIGSLWVMDALHLPYGCSVWPAWWSEADRFTWPVGGEIDTFESVNLQLTNQFALHTTAGCSATGTSANQLGTVTYPTCNVAVNSNSGCTVVDPRASAVGASFAQGGGGVYATQFANDGISIWFFPRSQVPTDLASSNASAVPDPSGWGLPAAYYPNSGCTISNFFGAQHLILDITLCGDWAGAPAVFNATCSGVCYTDYVLNASSYNNAYFEIPSIRVYNDPTRASPNGTSTPGSSSGNTGGSTAASSTTSGAAAAGLNARLLGGGVALFAAMVLLI